MNQRIPVLTITGSDNTGEAGIQADLKTITALGGDALTAVTAVTAQDSHGIQRIMDLPGDMVLGQVRAIIGDRHPMAIKVGMVRDAETIRALRAEVIGARQLVLVPGAVTSHGQRLLSTEAMDAWQRFLLPEATLLVVNIAEVELLLHRAIATDDDMVEAARQLSEMGARWIFMRGGHHTEGRVTSLLYGGGTHRFFSSENTDGWGRHGVGAALSSAIATCLALGDNMEQAISRAHEYLHSQVVYAVEQEYRHYRPADIYNAMMTLLAQHYREAHDVTFYASSLAISARYLCKVTRLVVDKSPKEIITDYLMAEALSLLATSRLTISEVAAALGFDRPAAFSKWFAANKGMSPVVFRNSQNP